MKKIRPIDVLELEIDLTGTCNLQCPICTRNYYHADDLLKKNIRNIEEITKQLSKFPNLNRIMLAGSISEPTLYPEFIKLIKYLINRNIFIDLFTNGNTRNTNFWIELGKLFQDNKSICTFTVCGSSEELHSKYRVNSSLKNILKNLKSFKSTSSQFKIQFIEFEYNQNDLYSENIKYIKDIGEWFIVQSEGRRRLTDFKKRFDKNIWPKDIINRKYNIVFKRFFKIKDFNTNSIICKSLKYKKLHIDQFGNMYPCYMLMEFLESRNVKIPPNDINCNDVLFDFEDIHSKKFDECKFCERSVIKLIELQKLDFIC